MQRTRPRGPIQNVLSLLCAGLLMAAAAAWGDAGTGPGPTPDAGPAIAILDFELNDLTPLPGTPEEIARTASIRPLLERALTDRGGYRLVPVAAPAQTAANVGFGYLYDHPEAAAALGQGQGADWVLVGRLHKPSFLFAYVIGRLVDTRTGAVAPDLVVEAKGPAELVTRRAAVRLAEQIDQTIARARTAPAAGR